MEKWAIYNANLGEGIDHEQSYNRPCIALMVDDSLGICVEVPLTSNLDALRFSNTISLPADPENKLRSESIVLLFHIRSISTGRIIGKQIGIVNEQQREKIKENLRLMLNL